jgi:hypothetical protein
MQEVQVPFNGSQRAFELDFATHRWSERAATDYPPLTEGEFPLVATLAEQRFELYSDGTFAEVER